MKRIILALATVLLFPVFSAHGICNADIAVACKVPPDAFVNAMGKTVYQESEIKPARQGALVPCTATANVPRRQELEQFVAGKRFVLVSVDGIEVPDNAYMMEFGKTMSFAATSCNTYRGRAEFSDYGYLFIGGRDFTRTPCLLGEASLIDDTLHEMVLNRANTFWDGSDTLRLSVGDDSISGGIRHVLVYRVFKNAAVVDNVR